MGLAIATKGHNTAKKLAAGILPAGVLMLGLFFSSSAWAETTTVTVTEASPQGWVQTEENGGTIEFVNTSGALGAGALEFTTPEDASYTRLRNNIDNVDLSSLESLSYQTKQVSGDTSVAATNLRLYVDTDADGTFDDVLVYEPYYNGTLDSTWQTWNISQTSGFWWSNNGDTYNGKGGVGAGSYASNFTLSDVVAQYPSVQVDEIGLGTGTTNFPWVVQADALTINGTTYDFEVAEEVVRPVSKEECKNGGWMTFSDLGFKNQGQCVASVVSSSNSMHNR